MHGFARDCLPNAPLGGYQAVLVAEGHLERWLDLTANERDENYLRQPDVLQEIIEAAQASVLHPILAALTWW
jgi:hypothetical protein